MADRWKTSHPSRFRPVRVLLWTLFAVCLFAGGELVLRACGTWPVLGWQRNYCPVQPGKAYARDVATGEALRRAVHAAEMALAEAPPCVPGASPAAAPPAPVPEPPQRSAESEAMDRRIDDKGGHEGLLQFTLAWTTLDDLDLNVTCPGGRLSSIGTERGPGICGSGVKDIDANRNLVENVSSKPVENVVWRSDYPEGDYKIEVIEYLTAGPVSAGNSIPFTLRMRLGDEERVCHGVVTLFPREDRVERNGVMVTGTAQVITWNSGQPLPQCEFRTEDTVRTLNPK